MNQRRGGLGRGLAALIPPGERTTATMQEVPLGAITPNPRQPRGVFDDEELEGLATSIRDLGVLQPIVVRPLEDERFELVAGERRLRAAKLAGLTTIPAVVRQTEDDALLKEALVENIHRVQLNPLEEAAAYSQLLEDFDFTQEELADRLGKSRPTISNSLRLLSLPPSVQRKVAAGVLTAGHAKAILALEERAEQERVADKVVAEGMSVRATEELVRLRLLDPVESPSASTAGRSRPSAGSARRSGRITAPGLIDLQENLSDALQARVKISMGARTGRIQIQFGSVDDLERIVGVIARGLQTEIAVDASDED
ncbi:MAG: ParB/RepB/Spo0J family partition protein [Nitriliruptorales bacterium]|nr:ParB/RepB/Spo0J family partition protein [Nitriliruptorales bacterium]